MIKSLFTFFLFILLIGNFYAQNWAPISTSIKSIYTKSQLPSPLACFDIDSIKEIGNDSTLFYNYQLYGENFNQNTDYGICNAWGGSCHVIQNKMSWMGREILKANNNWTFVTKNNDSLTFNFTNLDTTVVFENTERVLKINYKNDTINNLFGAIDSIKVYEILQYDSVNNLIQDELLNKTIRLSKHYGLLDFIEIRDYPDSIGFYTIKGALNNNDTIGKVTIKEYEIQQSKVGSITQFENKRETYSTCCPTIHPGYYYLETYETTGSGFSGNNYIQTFIKNDSILDSLVIDTNQIAYEIPFVRNKLNQRVDIKIDSTECYGKGYYLETNYRDCEVFCSTYSCYSGIDTDFGYCKSSFDIKTPNTWLFKSEYIVNAITSPPSPQHNLIYTSVDGNSCGLRAYSNIKEKPAQKMFIYPNPSKEIIYFKNHNSPIKKVTITDYSGKVLIQIKQKTNSLNVSFLPKGAYLVQIETKHKIFNDSFIKD